MEMLTLADNNSQRIHIDSDEFNSIASLCKSMSELHNEDLIISIPTHRLNASLDGDFVLRMKNTAINNNYVDTDIESGNIAGFVGKNDVEVKIHSRFSSGCKQDYFLMYMLSKTAQINLFNLPHSSSNAFSEFDFYILLFPILLQQALNQGLFKRYTNKNYNNARFNGTLNANEHLKKNIPFNGTVAYSKRVYSADNHLTQLIRHTIEFIKQSSRFGNFILSQHNNTALNINRIIEATPEYKKSDRKNIIYKNLTAITHPYFTAYRRLQKVCLMILRHENLVYDFCKDKISGILINMAWLWEEYLNEVLSGNGYLHPSNHNKTGTLYLDSTNRYYPRFPDFYKVDSDYSVVLDAKYKLKTGARDDVNQMITYMYRLKANSGFFINPSNVNSGIEYKHMLHGFGLDSGASIGSYSMLIPRNADDLYDFSESMKTEEKKLAEFFSFKM